jgi:hypothetical protein
MIALADADWQTAAAAASATIDDLDGEPNDDGDE